MPARPRILPTTRAGRLVLLVAFWVGVSLVLVGHAYLSFRARGIAYPLSAALFGASVGLSWIVLSPLVAALARHFPLDGARWGCHLLAHAAAALTIDVVTVALLVTPHLLLGAEASPGRAVTFRAMYVNSFLSTFLLYQLIYAAVVAVVHAQRYYQTSTEYLRKYREQDLHAARLERQLAEAQLHALRMQLNPHFLFNTLHAVSSLMTQDTRAARRMIVHLGDLLRLALDRAGESEVTLSEEMDFLRHYLEIEEVRFKDRLAVRIDIEPEALDALVPSLLLQPLVENAIKHGIAPFDRGGTVEIAAHRRQGRLGLFVGDDGPGLAGGGDGQNGGGNPASATAQQGIGLANTRERLEQLYGERFTFELIERAGGGLGVHIQIPFHTLSDHPERA